MSFRMWIYHAKKEPKIIDSDDLEEFEDDGWADSPAKFLDLKTFGVDKGDELGIQQIGDSVEGVKNSLNGALNLDQMDKFELDAYAKEHYEMDYDLRKYRGEKGLKRLRLDVRALTEAEYDHSQTGDKPSTH